MKGKKTNIAQVQASSNPDSLIEVKGLFKDFKDGTIKVLNGIDYSIKKGEKIVIIGPSGGGKSTFLRCLNLLEKPTAGAIYFNGEEITAPKCNINQVRKRWEWFSSISIFFRI